MSKVLPEFVNNIMNKVTSNNAEPVTSSGNNTNRTTSSRNNNINRVSSSSNANNINRVSSSSNANNINRVSSSSNANNINRVSSSSNANNMNKQPEQAIDSSKFDNLTNASHMRELLDSVVASNLSVDKRNRLLTVIKSSLVPTHAQENQDFNRMSQRYDFTNPNFMPPMPSTHYPASSPMMPGFPGSNAMMPGFPGSNAMMPSGFPGYNPSANMHMQQPGMINYAPPPYYNMQPQQQTPNVMYDILFNKMNMMQMEMADLTRHLRDYTRRYMDNMRESDMNQLKVYIDELMKVQESVSQLAPAEESAQPETEEETTPSGVIDKAKSTLKSGLSKVTDTVNSIGNTLGLTSEAAKDEDLEAEPDIDDNEMPDDSVLSSGSQTNSGVAAESAQSSVQTSPSAQAQPSNTNSQSAPKQSNMVSLEDYDMSEQTQPLSSAPIDSSQRQDASSGMPIPEVTTSSTISSSQRQNASSGTAPTQSSTSQSQASSTSTNKPASSNPINKKANMTKAPLVSAGQTSGAAPAELSDAITELNKKNQTQQQGGGLKARQSKKTTSILDQFEKMFKIKRQTKKQSVNKKTSRTKAK